MRYLKAFLKLAACFACFFSYLFIAVVLRFCFVFYKAPRRRSLTTKLTQLFARCLVFLMGIKIEVKGDISSLKVDCCGKFFVSNHLSYLDGFILGALFPVVYVTKTELKKWPLIGFMTEISGTLFVDRNHKGYLLGAIQEMAETLGAGGNVLYFPEGTSSNGDRLLPFVATFFEAPLAVGASVVPVSLSYRSVDGFSVAADNRDMIYWYGDMTFIDHFFNLLTCRSIKVIVQVHPCLKLPDIEDSFSRRMQRRHVCELAYKTILRGRYLEKKGLDIDGAYSCISAEKAD